MINMKPLYLQMFSLQNRNLTEIQKLHKVKELGFDGIEPLQVPSKATIYEMRRIGLSCQSCFSPRILENGEVEQLDLLLEAGIHYLNVGEMVSFGNREQTLRAAETINRLGRFTKSQGMKLYFHNHSHEWRRDGEDTLMDILLDHTDPECFCAEVDCGYSSAVGIDTKSFICRHPGRVELLHVKSSTGPMTTEDVWFMIPDQNGNFPLPPMGEPMPEEIAQKMADTIAKLSKLDGPMSQCLADYAEILPLAEKMGCKVFIIDRDTFYQQDEDQVLKDDLKEIRRLWP